MSIEVIDVTKRYGERHALLNVSVSIPSNCITALLGPNGSGKTTLMRILIGYLKPDSGTAKIMGIDVATNSIAVKQITGYLPENNPLYSDMFVKEYLLFIGKIKKAENLKRRLEEVIEITGIGNYYKSKIKELSKGYRQRVGIAASLINDPPVLILDEPTTGLDPIQVLEIRSLIRKIARNKTILFSTHILPEAEKTSDFVVIIHRGRIHACKKTDEIVNMNKKNRVLVVEWEKEPPYLPSDLKILKIGKTTWEIEYEDESPEHLIYELSNQWNIPVISASYRESPLESFFREIITSEQ